MKIVYINHSSGIQGAGLALLNIINLHKNLDL